jgi:hypothetical protein
MGAVVITLGLLLAVIGGVFFGLIVLDAGAAITEEPIPSWRLAFEALLPADPLGARAVQAIAFLVMVGPGLALLRFGMVMEKKENAKPD